MLAAIACRHRYEDDNYYSLRNPGKRLLGNWKIVAFNVDGADSIADLFKRTNYANCTFNSVYDKNYHVGKWTGCIDIWTYPGYFTCSSSFGAGQRVEPTRMQVDMRLQRQVQPSFITY
jgi:hypothetical protein